MDAVFEPIARWWENICYLVLPLVGRYYERMRSQMFDVEQLEGGGGVARFGGHIWHLAQASTPCLRSISILSVSIA